MGYDGYYNCRVLTKDLNFSDIKPDYFYEPEFKYNFWDEIAENEVLTDPKEIPDNFYGFIVISGDSEDDKTYYKVFKMPNSDYFSFLEFFFR
jgi:hypothetical protein